MRTFPERPALLPGMRPLERCIFEVRQAADQRLWTQLVSQLSGPGGLLGRLLTSPDSAAGDDQFLTAATQRSTGETGPMRPTGSR